MDGTSIRQTPERICLSNLKLFSFCGSSIKDSTWLVLLPFSGNSCLWDLYLTNCNIYKLPDNFSSFRSLRCLCLSRNNMDTLPQSIEKLYSLLLLDLKHCRKLNSLPVLPSNIQYVDAHGCVSLEKVAKPVTLPLVTERMHTTFIFTDCFKLNRAEQESIVDQAQRQSQLLARTSLQHNHKVHLCFYALVPFHAHALMVFFVNHFRDQLRILWLPFAFQEVTYLHGSVIREWDLP